MQDLIYYYVPKEFIFFDKKQKNLCNIDLTQWSQIDVADSLESRKNLNLWERMSKIDFFAGNLNKLAEFLWQIKGETEEVSLKTMSHVSKKHILEQINDCKTLEIQLDKVILQNDYHALLYMTDNIPTPTKIVYDEGGEMISIFFKEGQEDKLENTIKKWARKTEYYTFQLDLEDE